MLNVTNQFAAGKFSPALHTLGYPLTLSGLTPKRTSQERRRVQPGRMVITIVMYPLLLRRACMLQFIASCRMLPLLSLRETSSIMRFGTHPRCIMRTEVSRARH